jgi:hypothetical protein
MHCTKSGHRRIQIRPQGFNPDSIGTRQTSSQRLTGTRKSLSASATGRGRQLRRPRDARIDLTSPVRLAKPILNSEVRRAVVPCFKGRIRWGVPRLVSAAAEVKPQSRSAIDRPIVTSILWRPVVAPGSVAGLVLWDAASPIVIPAAPAAIRGFGDRADNGQCSDPDNQSSHAAHVCLLVHWQQLELGRSQIQIRTDRSELGQHPRKEHIANGEQIVYIAPSLAVRCRSSESGPIRSGSNDHRITSRRRFVHG